ncbi:unnamed protein product [Cyprideis torosa]|uniref:Uncharacterized protein n=1 Tax=Cyprideis torosa TaxID=163714 RepID=A0A7R8WCB2_9CRUS|nr:unnamed protein product [Cyprideis torosa]CAG0893134.1 unnamed protein product [Cyprideis torosa]
MPPTFLCFPYSVVVSYEVPTLGSQRGAVMKMGKEPEHFLFVGGGVFPPQTRPEVVAAVARHFPPRRASISLQNGLDSRGLLGKRVRVLGHIWTGVPRKAAFFGIVRSIKPDGLLDVSFDDGHHDVPAKFATVALRPPPSILSKINPLGDVPPPGPRCSRTPEKEGNFPDKGEAPFSPPLSPEVVPNSPAPMESVISIGSEGDPEWVPEGDEDDMDFFFREEFTTAGF